MRNEIHLSCTLNVFIAWGAGIIATTITLSVCAGLIDKRWGLAGGLMIALAHGLSMRHWIHGLAQREIAAFELGRESVRPIR